MKFKNILALATLCFCTMASARQIDIPISSGEHKTVTAEVGDLLAVIHNVHDKIQPLKGGILESYGITTETGTTTRIAFFKIIKNKSVKITLKTGNDNTASIKVNVKKPAKRSRALYM